MYANSKGLKYLHGVEIYLTASLDAKVRDNYHTILIAKNFEGIKEINLLIDKSTREDHMYYKPRITFDEFFAISDNVIKISACLASPLSRYPSSINEVYERLDEIKRKRKSYYLVKNITKKLLKDLMDGIAISHLLHMVIWITLLKKKSV